MNVGELINYLSQFDANTEVQMRNCMGDWTHDIEVKKLGLFVYLSGVIGDPNNLVSLAAREAQ